MQAEIMQAICEHAAAEYPNESCGFVVQNGRKARYLPCRNVAENALDNFVISPRNTRRRRIKARSFASSTATQMCPC